MIGGGHDGRLGGGDEAFLARRVVVLGGLIALVFAIFAARLFQLQVIEGADLSNRSERNRVRTVRLEAQRGWIVDREGRALAASRPAFGVAVIPHELSERERTLRAMAALLEREVSGLDQRIGKRRGRERFKSVVLDPDLDPDALARVRAHQYALPGVHVDFRPRRHYLNGPQAAHLLGTIGEIGARQLERSEFAGYRAGDVIGQSGLEQRLERHLRGRSGGRNLVVDVQGREVARLDEVLPVPGGRVVLTLDLDLQRVAEEAFRSDDPGEPDKMGALVAVDPRNGDVLALVSKPSYDPNDFAGGVEGAVWSQLTTDRWEPLQNRAVSGQYAPGSTYKAIVALAGLQTGVIDPARTVYCPGSFRLGRRTYRCWMREGHGDVDLAKALEQSCDVYFYTVGLELGIDRLAKFARGFGLGRRTGIGISGESVGIVPDKAWKKQTRKQEWIKGETVSAVIGQGFNLVTPLQLALAYAAIANGGLVYSPRIVERLETWDGRLVERPPRVEPTRVGIAAANLALVRAALTGVVEAPGGTGWRARVGGMEVAGKTGTTQVVSLSVLEQYEDDEDIPIKYRDHAWFAAFAPADAPEIALAVLVEHGGGGGRVAAPIAGKVLQAYYDKHFRPPEPELEAPAEPLEIDTARGGLEARSLPAGSAGRAG
ncbi:MAG: penicillin-binding protein 2 [Myxococcota bacterium]|nr:penicillin-binding protein 2 [Myxococcota bacterium]